MQKKKGGRGQGDRHTRAHTQGKTDCRGGGLLSTRETGDVVGVLMKSEIQMGGLDRRERRGEGVSGGGLVINLPINTENGRV